MKKRKMKKVLDKAVISELTTDTFIVVNPTRENAIEHLVEHWDVSPRVAIELARRKAVKQFLKNLRPKTDKKSQMTDVLDDLDERDVDPGAKEVPVAEEQVEELAAAIATGNDLALEDEDDD